MDKYAHHILKFGQTTLPNFLLKNYRKIGLSNDELLLYILIKHDRTLVIPMPEINQLAELTGYGQQQLFEIFHQMIQKKLAKITKIQIAGQQVDAYDFTLLYEKLALLDESESDEEGEVFSNPTATSSTPQVNDQERQKIFESIEKEFGRTLSPLEMESISQWIDLDHYTPRVIELALKEAVLNQVYNLKYMDRILRNWEQRNLKMPQQIEDYNRRRTQSSSESETTYKGPKIPFINLLNPKEKKD